MHVEVNNFSFLESIGRDLVMERKQLLLWKTVLKFQVTYGINYTGV